MPLHENCIFCNIISGKTPSEILFQNDEVIVFKDIKPASTHHFLVVPKNHIANINYLVTKEDKLLVERLITIGKKVLEENGGNAEDARIGFHLPPFNSINHLHLHVISPMSEMGFLSRLIFKPSTWWFQAVDDTLEKLIKKMEEIGKRVLELNGGDSRDARLGFHCPPYNTVDHLHLHVISPVSEMGLYYQQIFQPHLLYFQLVDDVLSRL